MGVAQPVTITLQDSARAPSSGVVQVTPLSLGQRLFRAGKTLLLLWLVALACAPLPGLHFVLVPGFFVSGLVVAVLKVRAVVRVDERAVPCPKCGTLVPVEAGTVGWPARLLCPECSARLVLTPAQAPQRPTS